MKKNYTLVFITGVITGVVIGIFGISLQTTKIQEIAVRKLFEKGVDSVTFDEEHKIDLEKTDREPPQLSIINVRLIDDSGSEKYELRANDKGWIECTVENIGGTAKDVGVYWKLKDPKKLPEQLRLDHPKKAISELRKNSSKVYKISVKTINMKKVGRFQVNLYPSCNSRRFPHNSEEFSFNVSPELEGK